MELYCIVFRLGFGGVKESSAKLEFKVFWVSGGFLEWDALDTLRVFNIFIHVGYLCAYTCRNEMTICRSRFLSFHYVCSGGLGGQAWWHVLLPTKTFCSNYILLS